MQLLHLHTPTSIPALQEFVNSNSPPIPPCFLPSDLEFCTHIALFQTAGLRLYTLNMSQIMQLFYSSGCLLALAYLGKMHSTKIQGLVKNYDAKNMSTIRPSQIRLFTVFTKKAELILDDLKTKRDCRKVGSNHQPQGYGAGVIPTTPRSLAQKRTQFYPL